MKNIILMVYAVVCILGLSNPAHAEYDSKEIAFPDERLVPGLKDCRFFKVIIDRPLIDQFALVIRCPNSDVDISYTEGKAQKQIMVIDKRQEILNRLTPEERKLIGVEK